MMTREEVIQLFKYIKMSYENFEVNSEKIDYWFNLFKTQDYQSVLKRLKKHVVTSKYPPTISELYEEPSESLVNHEHLAYMRRLRSGQLD